jgi:hypothetical protein
MTRVWQWYGFFIQEEPCLCNQNPKKSSIQNQHLSILQGFASIIYKKVLTRGLSSIIFAFLSQKKCKPFSNKPFPLLALTFRGG